MARESDRATAESVNLLIEAWKTMVGRLPGGTVEQGDGVATMLGHVPLPFLNMSVNDRPLVGEADVRAVLARAQERCTACGHPAMYTLCTDWVPADWAEVAAGSGLVPALNMTGMAADGLRAPRRPAPEMELRRVSDVVGARDVAMLNARGYGMPEELFECICRADFWTEDTHAYVGYAGGRPVSTATTFPVGGTVYVALVATDPAAQGKGYAEAVMRHAVEQGQQATGLTRTTLHATDMGAPVYRAMGYEGNSRFVVLAAGH